MYFHRPQPPSKKRKLDEENVDRFYESYTLETLNGEPPIILHPKETVELKDNSLLTIHHFEQHVQIENDDMAITVFVVGRRYLRFRDCQNLGGFLRNDPQETLRTPREVYQLGSNKKAVFGPDRPKFPVYDILRKVNLIKTNLSHRNFQSPAANTFICRYIWDKNAVIRLSSKEADEGRTSADDAKRRNMFLYRRANPPPPDPTKRYTFGDGFCGVGGTSAGARKAGLEVRWAFDGDYKTCVTYAENFHQSNVFAGTVNQYLSLAEHSHVDVLHISPPCQTFSAAHTIDGENDDDNSASLFCVTELLLKVRPRICTIEEVPGFIRRGQNEYSPLRIQANGRNYFGSLLRQILEAEYSVKWKILRAEEYGVPQCRERVIFMLAWYCPISSQLTTPVRASLSPTSPHPLTVQDDKHRMSQFDKPSRASIPETVSIDLVLATTFL